MPLYVGDIKVVIDADTVDGLHSDSIVNSIRSSGYALRETWIDARDLDENTWYPVTIQLSYLGTNVRIEASASLAQSGKPSWAQHANGFSSSLIWETNGYGYGAQEISRIIYVVKSKFTTIGMPIRGISQGQNDSIEYVYVRGGGALSLQMLS